MNKKKPCLCFALIATVAVTGGGGSRSTPLESGSGGVVKSRLASTSIPEVAKENSSVARGAEAGIRIVATAQPVEGSIMQVSNTDKKVAATKDGKLFFNNKPVYSAKDLDLVELILENLDAKKAYLEHGGCVH